MPTRIGDDKTSFIGTQENWTTPGEYTYDAVIGDDADNEGMLTDQAVVYQYLTGKQLDGSTAYSGDQQIHDGTDGALIPWPIGSAHITDDISDGTLHGNDKSTKAAKILGQSLNGSASVFRVVLAQPVFVPTGHDILWCFLDADESLAELNPTIGIYDPSTPPATFTKQAIGGSSPTRTADGYWLFALPIASTGQVNIFTLEIDASGVASGEIIEPSVRGWTFVPQIWRQLSNLSSPIEITNPTGAETPRRGSAFVPIWDTFVAPELPLSSYVTTLAAENDGYLHELVTGAAVPGLSRSIDGHNHDGTTTGGATIEIPLLSEGYGWATKDSFYGFTTAQAINGRAPTISASDTVSTWYVMAPTVIQPPIRTGSPAFNWAMLVYDANSVPDQCDVRVSTSTNYSSWTNSATASSSAAGGWQYLTGTASYTSGTLTYVRAEAYAHSVKAGCYISLLGFAIWDT